MQSKRESLTGEADAHGEVEPSTHKQSSRKSKAAEADVIDVKPEQVEATLARIKPQLEAQDYELMRGYGAR